MKIVKGYKAFNKGLKCQGFQFKEGESYKADGNIELCKNGFHFCENPFDVLNYYNLTESEFANIEATADIKKDGDKSVTSDIHINAKLSFKSFIECCVSFVIDICKTTTTKNSDNGEHSAKIGSSGYSAQIGSSGDYAQIGSSGKNSVISAIGNNSIAKGIIGSWIVLAEWKMINDEYTPTCVKSVKIDGKKIKENVFYKLIDGNFKEVE